MNDIMRFMDEKGRIKTWAAKNNIKLEILKYISTKFECGRFYTEKEVNKVLDEWHTFGDYFLIRRGLIDYGLLSRTTNGSKYWKEERTSMIKAVIFDMDGVIIDSEPIHFESDKMTMKEYGIELTDEELNHFVGTTNAFMWAELCSKYKLSCSVEELLKKQSYYKNYLFGNRKLEPISGISELLNELKSVHIKIGLAFLLQRLLLKWF